MINILYAELANALAAFKPQLAAQIGGIAFERMVRQRVAGVVQESADKDLKTLIDDLRDRGLIDDLMKGHWHRARRGLVGSRSPTVVTAAN